MVKKVRAKPLPVTLPENAPSSPMTESSWRGALSIFSKTNNWNPALGPAPGSPNCEVPAKLLAEIGLAG